MRWTWSWVVVLCLVITGCNINRDIMFKTPVDFQFDQLPDTLAKAFKIQPNDVLQFRLFANDGFRMIDLVDEQGTGLRNLARITFNYQVDFEGKVKLPLLGMVKVSGLSMRETELLLEKEYTLYYNKPFVQVTVANRRVVVFPGGGGDAKVIILENNNTTLTEVLGTAGGVAKRGDSRKIKVFRRKPEGGRLIYEFNLSDISGLRYGDLIMQADDIVYVQPNPEIAREILENINPIITLLTTTVLVIGVVKGFSK